MKKRRFSSRPILLDAEPTLRGLRILENEASRVCSLAREIPWLQTGFVKCKNDRFWLIYDDKGEIVKSGASDIRAIVKGGRASTLAQCAQARAFLNEWKNGTLRLPEIYHPECAPGWPSLVAGSALAITLPVFLLTQFIWGPANRFWHETATLPAGLRTPSYLLIVGAFLLFTFLSAVVMRFALQCRPRPHLKSAEITANEIAARWPDGAEMTCPWSEAARVRYTPWRTEIHFKYSRSMNIADHPPRTTLVLELVQVHYLREQALKAARRQRREPVRVLAGSVVCAILGIWLFRSLSPFLPRPLPIWVVPIMTIGPGVCFALLRPAARKAMRVRLRFWRRRNWRERRSHLRPRDWRTLILSRQSRRSA